MIRSRVCAVATITCFLTMIGSGAALAEPPAPEELPQPIFERLVQGARVGDFVNLLVEPALEADLDGNGLDQRDIDTAVQVSAAESRAGPLGEFLKADLDGDGRIGTDEARRFLLHERRAGKSETSEQGNVAQAVEAFMTPDTDQDGFATIAELAASMPRIAGEDPETELKRALLTLDGDGDGRVTAVELTASALAIFGQADTDGDGTLSQTEVAQLMRARQLAIATDSRGGCALPPAGATDDIFTVYAYDGQYLSSIALTKQHDITNLTKLHVAPGDRPLYLVVASYEPMVWQIEGAVERVVRVVAARPYGAEGGADWAGVAVAGIVPQRVTFLPYESCGGRANAAEDGSSEPPMAKVVQKRLGRAPVRAIDIYGAEEIRIPSGEVVKPSGDRDIAITGGKAFLLGDQGVIELKPDMPLVERETLFAKTGGVVQLDPAAMVVSGRAEPYQVFPGEDGLRQLVLEGKLERTDHGYRIVQPFPYFPPRIAGQEGVVFIVPSGMPLPAGEIDPKQIVRE